MTTSLAEARRLQVVEEFKHHILLPNETINDYGVPHAQATARWTIARPMGENSYSIIASTHCALIVHGDNGVAGFQHGPPDALERLAWIGGCRRLMMDPHGPAEKYESATGFRAFTLEFNKETDDVEKVPEWSFLRSLIAVRRCWQLVCARVPRFETLLNVEGLWKR